MQKRAEIIDEILAVSSFAVGNGDVCEVIARRLRRLAEKIDWMDVDPTEMVQMSSLCWTESTLYAVDVQGRVWYIEMKTGKWALHGNPTEAEAVPK